MMTTRTLKMLTATLGKLNVSCRLLLSNYDGFADTVADGWWVRQLPSNGWDVHDPWPNDGPHKKPYDYAT
jgi:hypothetical protein